MKRQYLVVLEKGENNYSAFSPDVLGCASTGRTFEETLSNMQDALEFHLEGMAQEGEPIPLPKGLNYHLTQVGEISPDDVIEHISVEVAEMALA